MGRYVQDSTTQYQRHIFTPVIQCNVISAGFGSAVLHTILLYASHESLSWIRSLEHDDHHHLMIVVGLAVKLPAIREVPILHHAIVKRSALYEEFSGA
jgi:hypothetical protein